MSDDQDMSNGVDWTVDHSVMGQDLLKICPLPPATKILYDDEPLIECGSLSCALNDEWEVDVRSLTLIEDTLAAGHIPDEEIYALARPPNLEDLKLEEAILGTDHEIDILRLKRRNEVGVTAKGMAAFSLSRQEDETLHWPSTTLGLPCEIARTVRSEKLEVSRDTVRCLRDIIECKQVTFDELVGSDTIMQQVLESFGELSQVSLLNEALTIDQSSLQSRQLTPPLLPLSPRCSPPPLVTDATTMDLTSSPENPALAELAALEQEFMLDDDLGLDEIIPLTSLRGMDGREGAMGLTIKTPLSSPLGHESMCDLRAETPLLAAEVRSSERPSKRPKTISLDADVMTALPSGDSSASIFDTQRADEDFASAIDSKVLGHAIAAVQESLDEKLSAADTILRVVVPKIDSVRTVPPWETYLIDDQGQSRLAMQNTQLSYAKHELLKHERLWGGVSKLEQSLPWSPFPVRLGKVELAEDLDDYPLPQFSHWLPMNGETAVRTPSLTFTCEGAIGALCREDDEEEVHMLAVGTVPDGDSIEQDSDESIVLDATRPPKRSDRPAETEAEARGVERTKPSTLDQLLRRRLEALRRPRSPTDQRTDVLQHDKFRADEGGLSDFMRRTGQSKAIPTDRRSDTRVVVKEIPTAPMLPSPSPPGEGGVAMDDRVSMPCPAVGDVGGPPASVIISCSAAVDRRLRKRLETQLGQVRLVERDFSGAHGDEEADVIVSPGTGLLLTTLQKVKQRPLPGQKEEHFGVRARMAAVSLRYERLIVLVSGAGRGADEDAASRCVVLDQRDCEALSELTRAAVSLDTEVQVVYVAGDDDELARWVVSAVVQYGLRGEVGVLLQEQTTWEVFLREAGLNGFAAQAVLKALKGPGTDPAAGESSAATATARTAAAAGASDNGTEGLAALIRMEGRDRSRRFERLMGGARVLGRVNEAMDHERASRRRASRDGGAR